MAILSSITRRALFRAAPAIAVAGALPVAAFAAVAPPVEAPKPTLSPEATFTAAFEEFKAAFIAFYGGTATSRLAIDTGVALLMSDAMIEQSTARAAAEREEERQRWIRENAPAKPRRKAPRKRPATV